MSSTPEYNREYYKKNRKRVLARNKAWNKANPKAIKKNLQTWLTRHPEGPAQKSRRYINKNRKTCRERCRDYQKRNPGVFKAIKQKRRAAKTKAGGSFTPSQWKTLCENYNNRCLCCGKKRKLTADHVIPVSKGGSSDISNIQPLCGPCNSSKGSKTVDYRGL